jgi:predicted enzyme related to lactoylglutathione lyase
MKSMTTLFTIAVHSLAACGGSQTAGTTQAPPSDARKAGLRIKHTVVYVDDQDKALRFYTEVLGFAKKTDESNGPYRWLTVGEPDAPDGVELQLALNDNPATKTYQQAMFEQQQSAAMFYTADVQADYDRMKALGAEFTMPPTDVTFATIAVVKDTCGNLIQLTQLAE